MDKSQSYFVYNPPKSNSHGHGVRDKNVKRATQKVIDALVSSFNATTDNKLQLTLSYNKKSEFQKGQKTIKRINEFLGSPKKEWDSAEEEDMDNTITWENDNADILEFLEYIDKLDDDSY